MPSAIGQDREKEEKKLTFKYTYLLKRKHNSNHNQFARERFGVESNEYLIWFDLIFAIAKIGIVFG